MSTLILAQNQRTAETVARYFYYTEVDRLTILRIGVGFDTPRKLRGIRPTRIVIATDYLRWDGPPGMVTEIWSWVQRERARGAKVVFK